jgi:hypothetical protein
MTTKKDSKKSVFYKKEFLKKNNITRLHLVLNKCKVNPQVLRGFLDADGSINAYIRVRKRASGANGYSIAWTFTMTQSLANKSNLDAIAEFCNTRVNLKGRENRPDETGIALSPVSFGGNLLYATLIKTPPLVPSRFRDFRLFQVVYGMQMQNKTGNKLDFLLMVSLIYQMSNQISDSTVPKEKLLYFHGLKREVQVFLKD